MKITKVLALKVYPFTLTLFYSEQPKLYRVLAVLSEIGLSMVIWASFSHIWYYGRENKEVFLFQEHVAIQVVDGVLEDIRLGMEV